MDLTEWVDIINAIPIDELPADLIDDVVARLLAADNDETAIPVARFGSAI